MNCYKLVDGALQLAQDPIGDNSPGEGYTRQLYEAGYLKQLSSLTHDSENSEITLYATTEPNKPQYYIDITGHGGQMVVLLADDFPSLVKTLKEIAPLISLIGLSQQTEIQTELILARDKA